MTVVVVVVGAGEALRRLGLTRLEASPTTYLRTVAVVEDHLGLVDLEGPVDDRELHVVGRDPWARSRSRAHNRWPSCLQPSASTARCRERPSAPRRARRTAPGRPSPSTAGPAWPPWPPLSSAPQRIPIRASGHRRSSWRRCVGPSRPARRRSPRRSHRTARPRAGLRHPLRRNPRSMWPRRGGRAPLSPARRRPRPRRSRPSRWATWSSPHLVYVSIPIAAASPSRPRG